MLAFQKGYAKQLLSQETLFPNGPTLVPEVFFCREETRQGRERSGERKLLVAGDANLTIML